MLKTADILDRRYQILDLIATGGEGDVYRARSQKTGALVAIKQLNIDKSAAVYERQAARFRRAAGLRFGHPSIPDPLECIEEGGELYLITPFVEGADLEAFVLAHGRLSPELAVQLLLQLARCLAAAHRQGVIHRDLKPQNIIIRPNGSVALLDFGICSVKSQQTITNGEILGTPSWMSPEQTLSAHVDRPSDLFSFGLIMLFVLTGETPAYRLNEEQATRTIRETDFPRPSRFVPEISPQLDSICARLLERKPERRFSSADELADALENCLSTCTDKSNCTGSVCRSCQHALDHDALFCSGCGAAQNTSPNSVLCLACRAPIRSPARCWACGRDFSKREHLLLFNSGSAAGTVFRIPNGDYLIGRDVLEPRDFSISRHHLRVCCMNDVVSVQDAGSANKTFVEGRLTDVLQPLKPNQEILIAQNHAIYQTN